MTVNTVLEKLLNGGRLSLQVTSLGWGGTERYVQDLSIKYAELGLKPLVLVDCEPMIRQQKMEAAGVEVELLDVPSNISNKQYKVLLLDRIEKHDIKLLHANAWARWTIIHDACLEKNIHFVRTLHGTPEFSMRRLLGLTWPSNFLRIWSERYRAWRTKPAMICISRRSQEGLERLWGKSTPAVTVHLGVPPSMVKASPEKNGSGPTFFWAGSFIASKRPLLTLKAFSTLLDKYPNTTLVMAGDGPLRAKAESYARNHTADRVHFTGFIPNVLEYMAQSQVFVLSSIREGLPYVNLEAMSVGLPIITTNCGSVAEAVLNEETGLVVAVNHYRLLIQSMQRMAANPYLRSRMGSLGYQRWQQMFNLDKMVNDIFKAYLVLLSN